MPVESAVTTGGTSWRRSPRSPMFRRGQRVDSAAALRRVRLSTAPPPARHPRRHPYTISRTISDPQRSLSTVPRDALVPEPNDDRTGPSTPCSKALSSACSRNPPRFLVDRPHGGEHHDLVERRASAGSSTPEHSAV